MNRLIAWMADNGVAANLLMLFLLYTGLVSAFSLTQQLFPEITLDVVQVRVPYPGASPEEVEDAIVRRIEERLEGIEGIDELRATAAEGVGIVTAELRAGADVDQKLDEIQAAVNRITAFPVEAEEPEVTQPSTRQRVMAIAIYGDVSERTIKELAYRAESELAAKDAISFVQVSGIRNYEVSIEVSKDALRAYDLSLPQIAQIVRQNSLDLPGGDIETSDQEIVLRVEGQNYDWHDYASIIVLGTQQGAQVRLGDIAAVEDAFQDADLITRYNGAPAALVDVYRTGDEKVLDVVDAARQYLDEELRPSLPPGVQASIWRNNAEEFRGRLNLLIKNGLIGLLLVVIALTLFLNVRLAFWVSVGIGISFVGTFTVMNLMGWSINQLSMFGFILSIGIVVDDAIVVGENTFAEREQGTEPLEAAVRGAQRVSVPVIFAVSTTIAAFTPLLFLPGTTGKFMDDIPSIVITVLALSIVESLLILPHHLSNVKTESDNAFFRFFERAQSWVDERLHRFINGPLERALRFVTRHTVVTMMGGTGLLLLMVGLLVGGYIRFVFFPQIEGSYVTASIQLPEGTTVEVTRDLAEYIRRKGLAVADSLGGEGGEDTPPLVENVYVMAGTQPQEGGPGGGGASLGEPNAGAVVFELIDPGQREVLASTFEQAWREAVGTVPGADDLSFSAELIGVGSAVQVELSAPDEANLKRAVERVTARLREIGGVYDIWSSAEEGKREVELTLKPQARAFGVTLEELAQQVRAAYFGIEALRVQRGREEVRVYVRLPEEERDALADLSDYRIRVPSAGEQPGGRAIPLEEVATLDFGVAPSTIDRLNGRRIVTVSADVQQGVVTGGEVNAQLRSEILPQIQQEIPGLTYTFGGEQEQQQETISALVRNFLIALFAIFALLAIPFRSYVQPLVIMGAIPFGFIGATIGHLLLGLNFTILSLIGIVGLSGVIINDALVMIDFINERRMGGMAMRDAVVNGAKSRFRPILLTSITTFLGVAPLILETSVQAQFLIPVAVSLGFGILFGTVLLMLIVPALAMMHYNAERRFKRRALGREEDEIEVVHGSHGEG